MKAKKRLEPSSIIHFQKLADLYEHVERIIIADCEGERLLKKLFSGIVLALLLAGMLPAAFNVHSVRAAAPVWNIPIYILANGTVSPSSAPIQRNGSLYTLTNGIFANTTGIIVQKSNVTVDGTNYTINGNKRGSGFNLTGINHVAIKNIRIANFSFGIWLDSSSDNNSIDENTVANNTYGIWLNSSSYDSVSGNNITNNWDGIILRSSSNISLSRNVFVDDGMVVTGFYGNVVTGNLVNGKPLVYLEGASGYKVADAGQVILVRCNNMTVESLNLSKATIGVQLWATNNTVISGNDLTANTETGIILNSSSNDRINGNNMANDTICAIYLRESSDNSVSGNNITASSNLGIELHESSNNNTISGNNIANDYYGIYLISSSNNSIYHNSFINNTNQVTSTNSTNVWDEGYPSGGNYWSDFTGVDVKNGLYQNQTGSDGIGDTPYVIDSSLVTLNIDRYPLMGIFNGYLILSRVPRLNNVTVISNSTITDFIYPISIGNPEIRFLMFNVTGKEGSTGFCRVSIPTAIMNGTYHVSVNGTEVPYTLLPCSNANVSYLYFTYKHSTEKVIIIPEFPSFLMLPIMIMATLLAVIIHKKKVGIPKEQKHAS